MFRATKAMKAVGTMLSAGLLMGFALLRWAALMPGGERFTRLAWGKAWSRQDSRFPAGDNPGRLVRHLL